MFGFQFLFIIDPNAKVLINQLVNLYLYIGPIVIDISLNMSINVWLIWMLVNEWKIDDNLSDEDLYLNILLQIRTRGESDPLTCLIPDLSGIDPDDAFSSVPYEKGHTFLWYLEQLVGGPGINS